MSAKNNPQAEGNRLGANHEKRGRAPGFIVHEERAGVQSGTVPPTFTVTPRLLYDVREAAELLSVSPAFLRGTLLDTAGGTLRSVRVGARRLIHWRDLQEWAQARREAGE